MTCLPDASSYWDAFWRRRLSRRRLLSTAAALAPGLGIAALSCNGDSPAPSPRASPGTATPDDGHVPASANGRGGTLRLPGFEAFIADTLDPHQTQFGPIFSSHSSVFSKILRYEDATAGLMATDLAADMPESIDGQEYVITLRPGVKFHQPSLVLHKSPSPQETAVAGRELTAEDIVYSFRRQMEEASPRRRFYFRSYQYEQIQTMEAVDPYTVRLVMKEPLAVTLHYLADTNAFIIPREVVDSGDQVNSIDSMIGTGPFVWEHLQPLYESRFVRNPQWFGWGDPEMNRPYIDGYRSLFLPDDAPLESTFRQKDLDSALQVTNPKWVRKLREDFPEVLARDVGFVAWLNSRFLVDRPPFNDLRVRKAIHLVSDRQQMIDGIFDGSALMQGLISPVLERWALSQEELSTLPGYRSGAQREADIREARQMFEAAGSPEFKITFADQPEYVPNFASQFQRLLEETLGAKVRVDIRGYLQIGEGLVRGDIQMTWQYDNGWIDPDDWLYPSFHSGGTRNTFRYQDPQLDAMLEAQRREFDEARRQALVRDIQHYLLENVLARLDYATPINLWVAWPYYRNFVPSPFWGESFRLAEAWIDRDNPSYNDRPS